MLYTIKGKVMGKNGLPVRRRLFAYNRESGDMISDTYSDFDTGEYTLVAYTPNPVMVICQPNSGETLNALVYDNVTPIMVANDNPTGIGEAGAAGFGVGVAPELPVGFIPMPGHNNPYHENYGNYQYQDGSIMCWIPAFYYKWGTGTNGLVINKCEVRDYSFFTSEADANAEGFALHRAFIDGGEIKKGFFVDKYLNSKHPTLNMTSSLVGGIPVSTSGSTGIGTLLTGGIPNSRAGCITAAKLRATGFFCKTIFIQNALAVLSKSHGDGSGSPDQCAWFGTSNNFPKGNTTQASGTVPCIHDNTLRCWQSLAPAAANSSVPAGGWNYQAKVTHNGQLCGVSDLSGNLWETSPGITKIGSTFRILKESVKISDCTGGNTTSTDLWGNGSAVYDDVGTTISDIPIGSTYFYMSEFTTAFSQVVDRNSLEYKLDCCGIPIAGSTSTTNTDYFSGGILLSNSVSFIPATGGAWGSGGTCGLFALSLYDTFNTAATNTGFRCAYYV